MRRLVFRALIVNIFFQALLFTIAAIYFPSFQMASLKGSEFFPSRKNPAWKFITDIHKKFHFTSSAAFFLLSWILQNIQGINRKTHKHVLPSSSWINQF